MTRPIKFRAWDGKEMIYDCGICPSGGDTKHRTENGKWSFRPDAIPLMQFTGLLDKNGKEIWEGDILQSQFSSGEINWIGHVVWGESKRYDNGYSCIDNNYGWHIKTDDQMTILRSHQDFKVCEPRIAQNGGIFVVGNIYENHEISNVRTK